jgi:hypothetical protein
MTKVSLGMLFIIMTTGRVSGEACGRCLWR